MNWILEPTVTILAASETDFDESLDLYTDGWHNSNNYCNFDADFIPEFAGRVCYQSFTKRRPGGNKEYLKHILELGHGSILEHSVITFLITGVSRSLTHELIRHRAGTAFSELSQRYYEVSDGRLGFILPPDMIGDEALTAAMTLEVRHAIKKYDDFTTMLVAKLSNKWLEESPEKNASREDLTYIRKSARQAARAILPNCTETHMVMTGNIRAWRNIIEQRGSIHADKEIRRLACKIAELSKFLAPNCFQDLELYTDTDGSQSARFTFRKV